jgi:hypothetical protein
MGWAGEAEECLFDSWFDPIEDGPRAKVRGFIETMIEEELTSALSRPRYGRRRVGRASDAGCDRASACRRRRGLTGTFGPIEIVVPNASPWTRVADRHSTCARLEKAARW